VLESENRNRFELKKMYMSNDIHTRINVLKEFGFFLRNFLEELKEGREVFSNSMFGELDHALEKAGYENPWFTREFQLYNLEVWSKALDSEKVEEWISAYPELFHEDIPPGKIGLVLAGNIPLVGLHDVLCVLVSGNIAVTRLSSKDRIVYPVLKKILTGFHGFSEDQWIILEDTPLKQIDAVIATGSNNSARYFDYYFGKYPNIIRKNRNSVAILDGEESLEDLKKLADDIFLYFGLGCRNVSKIFVPQGFTPDKFYEAIEHYSYLYQHSKYANNYDYQRAILLVNRIKFYDNGFLVLREDHGISSPIGSLFFETYANLDNLYQRIHADRDKIQCIIGKNENWPELISFGSSQIPGLNEYADDIDTLKFLTNLSKK
jgi:hypothetical protein